jgi:hypothetical protein
VAAVEAELARQLDRLGLGAPLTGEVAVADVWARVVGGRQGVAAAGALVRVVDAAAAAVERCVRLHAAPAEAGALLQAQAQVQAGDARSIKAALAERDAACAKRDALRAERDALRADRDALRAERDTLCAKRDAMPAKLINVTQ